MNARGATFTPRNVTVAALLLAAIGFVIQMVSGVTDTPTIPPGLVVILAAAGLVAVSRASWVSIAGPVAGLFNLVAFVVVGAAGRLLEPADADAFLGTWLMILALIVAAAAGTVATIQTRATRETH